MKKFIAIYLGSKNSPNLQKWLALDEATRKQREAQGIQAWMAWGEKHADAILDGGAPLGKTKQVDKGGLSDITNLMTGYAIVQAESHEAAAKLFVNHPHFSIFPGDSIEIMECLPIPGI